MHLNRDLSSVFLHGRVDQRILTITRSRVSDHVAAAGSWIYGVEEETVNIFHVLINRPTEIDLENKGNNHSKKLDSKHTQAKPFTTIQHNKPGCEDEQ